MPMRRLALVVACLLGAGCESEIFEPPDDEGSWILVDLLHTQLQNPVDHRLDRGVYAYQGVHGFSRLFDHLGDHGYPWTATRTMRIDEGLLEGFSVLFVNLLHRNYPDFEPEEISAIQAFVEAGGGLFVIADHSNVYRHAERLAPLLAPMGIEVGYHTALDSDAVAGSAWILIRNLAEHPTNEGIELLSFQTGGVLESQLGTAFLSEDGFGDFWDESNDEGFYGNWRYDGDPSLEPRGADTPVIAAGEYGAGRVLVVGDQNVYGDVWLHFADNFAHALNGFEWLARREDDATPLRAQPVRGLDLGVELVRSSYALGQGTDDRYYGLFHHLNRHQGVTARAEGHLERARDAWLLPTPREDYSEADVEAVQAHLQAGKRVVVLFDVARLTGATVRLLRALAPGFGFDVAGVPADLAGTPEEVVARLSGGAIPRLEGLRAVEVAAAACPGHDFSPADLERLEVGAREPDRDGERRPVVLDVTSDWGRPLLAAGGRDLARAARVGEGELVLVLQDAMLRSGTLGANEAERPEAPGEEVAELLYGLLDYLRTPVGCP